MIEVNAGDCGGMEDSTHGVELRSDLKAGFPQEVMRKSSGLGEIRFSF